MEAELRQARHELEASHQREALLLEQQTATAEVLRVIASSPTDLDTVLQAIIDVASRLCDADDGILQQYRARDGKLAARVATGQLHDVLAGYRRAGQDSFDSTLGISISRQSISGRAFLEGRTIAVDDVANQDEFPEARRNYERNRSDSDFRAHTVSNRSQLVVPLLRGGEPIGGLLMGRVELPPFTEREIALLESFADQAVIAIENARLFEELDRRNAELQESNRQVTESLEQQTATADILRVIASSPTDLQHVLDVIAASTVRLCGAESVVIRVIEGDNLRRVALAGTAPARGLRLDELFPISLGTVVGRAVIQRMTIHIPDVQADLDIPLDEYSTSMEGARLATPLLREGTPFGGILLLKPAAGPFSDRQIALLETFADQAVIAIENARLFGELADLNRTLETRVREQVGELERVGRLRRYLAPQLADLIVSSGDESILKSHRRQITVVFCDLRGFTAFAETAEPEEVMAVLDEYHAAMGEQVRRYEGTLDRFAGDGLMVFFNDPLPQDDHAERAVRMACAMRDRAAELARGWRRAGHELDFGVGIAVGYATLGRIGFEGRYDYTAIGTVANLAARLCGEAAGGQILIPARLHGMVEEMAVTETLGDLSLKGFQRPVDTLNVTGLRNGERPDSLGTE